MATATASRNGHSATSVSDVIAPPTVEIDAITTERLLVPIVGTSPLIVHRFSEKAKRQMLDKKQGRTTPKEPCDPVEEYEAALYRMTDGRYGFPVVSFKAASIAAARFYPKKQLNMTQARQFFFITGEVSATGEMLVEIAGEPRMREDVVRVGMGGTDLRYRPEFWPWRTTLDVTYVPSVLQRSTLLSLIDAGGMGVGIGEWRPEKDGTFGTFRIDPDRVVEVVR